MLGVVERENQILKECIEARRQEGKLYIYGSGQNGKMLYEVLQMHQIRIDGFCVDAAYFSQENDCGLPVVPVGQLVERAGRGEKIAAVVAFLSETKRCWDDMGKLHVIDADFWSFGSSYDYKGNRIDLPFVQEHEEILSRLYLDLEDEKSRQCLTAFLNQKISGNFQYLEPLYKKGQYYDKEVVSLTGVRCIVDCGAFDGDSFRAFCSHYEQACGKPYRGYAYLLEPGVENYERLSALYTGQDQVMPLNLGAWQEQGTIYFEGSHTSGRIAEGGTDAIAVETIDHIVAGCGGGRKGSFSKWILKEAS